MTTMNMNAVNTLNTMPAAGMTSGNTYHRRAVFVLTEKTTPDGQRTFWTKVGAAFDNKDGSGTVKLDALPLSGTLQIREDDRDQRRDRANAAPF